MFDVLHTRNSSYSSSLLCFIIVCILAVCTANESREVENLSYTDLYNASLITSSGNEFYEIVSDEITNYSVIRSIVSKKPVAGKSIGYRGQITCISIGNLFILAGIGVFFLLYF